MISRHRKCLMELSHVKLLPVVLVVLQPQVVLDPVEGIGEERIFRERAEAEEFQLTLQSHAFQLRGAIPKGFERLSRGPLEHEAELKRASTIDPLVASHSTVSNPSCCWPQASSRNGYQSPSEA